MTHRDGPAALTADEEARAVTRRANRTITIIQWCEGAALFAAIVVIAILIARFVAVTGVVGRQGALIRQQGAVIQRDAERTQAACAFWADIGNLPVQAPSSRLGVGIVVHSRDAWTGFACPGRLAAPQAELFRLARKYGITVRY